MKSIGIYIHIPFCVRKCNYCDFLSAPGDEKTQELYFRALKRQIAIAGQGEDISVCSIFIGGGTPSIWKGEWIYELISCVRSSFNVEADAEITIECNPGTLTAEKLSFYKKAGINRLSIGLQSANNDSLLRLGRIHTWEEFLHSFSLAREAGFNNINIDIMSGLPDESFEEYKNTLRRVVELAPEHISAYSLIIEEGTPFYNAKLNLPDEDTERGMYHYTKTYLRENGYERYEISNYAKAGRACRHNKLYWTGVDYLGFGIGAASLYEGKRFKVVDSLTDYIAAANNVSFSCDAINIYLNEIITDIQPLSTQDKMEEFCFLGLRLMEGISMSEFEKRFGFPFLDIYRKVVEKYEKLGRLERLGDRLRLTDAGIDVSNIVLADFLL